MRIIYVPYTVPRSFSLNECLSWIEVGEYPINPQKIISEGDFWYSMEHDGEFTPLNRTNPQRNFSLSVIPDFLYGNMLDEDDKAFLTECGLVLSSDDAKTARMQWEEKQEELIETAQLKLFLALKNGSLKAYGILTDYNPYEDENFEKFIEDSNFLRFMDEDVNSTKREDLSEIPANLLRMAGIDWTRCTLTTQDKSAFYSHVRIFKDDLFVVYPESPPQDFIGKHEGIEMRGNFLVSSDENKLEIPTHSKAIKIRKRAGRPPQYDWDGFKVEVTRYILEKGGLPRLQKDLETHMLEWCPFSGVFQIIYKPYYTITYKKGYVAFWTFVLINPMCAAFSEMERELIRERVKAGLDAAHQKGRKGGRPKAITPEKLETVWSLKKSGDFSVNKICEMAGITRSVYYRTINRAA